MSVHRWGAKRNGSKYRAQPTVVDGIRFASKKEATRYQELKLLERAGKIAFLDLQVPFVLRVQPTSPSSPIDCSLGKYLADFVYEDRENGEIVVEDVKGFRTPLYRWKKKHVEAQYGITIREV